MSVMLSMLMLSTMAVAETEPMAPVAGRIVEVREDGYLLDLLEGGQMHVLANEDTKEESDWAIGVGDVVLVSYAGEISGTELPQVTAQTIRSHTLEGDVEEVNEESNRILVDTVTSGEVWVTLPADASARDYDDKDVRVYFNGIMALSLPAQAGALAVETVEDVDGRVTEVGTDYFVLEDDGSQVRVNFDAHTKVIDSFNAGDEVQVFYNGIMTRSMPPQVNALVILKD